MRDLYIIPNRNKIQESLEVSKVFGAAFEYNDFFYPAILEDEGKIKEIIDFYKALPRDRSKDTLHGAFFDVTLHSTDPKIREISELRVRQSMDIARAMGLRGAIFHTNMIPNFKPAFYVNHWIKSSADFYKKLADEYPDIQIFVENMFDDSPDMLRALAVEMQGVESFGICLDYAHASISGTPVERWVESLLPFVKHMHINDNNLKDDEHRTIGQGDIDYHVYSRYMKENNVQSSVLIEMNDPKNQLESLIYLKKEEMYPF